MAGGYLPNGNYLATTKQEAWNMAQEELRMDREEGRKVRKLGNQEWLIQGDSTDYICEIATCYEADCLQDIGNLTL
tara:strand:- start:127 stop:354 length:228 start_codon:yes stop_codon:yes gene_type:complete